MVRCESCGKQHVPTRNGLCPHCGAPATGRVTGGGGGVAPSSSNAPALEFFLNAQWLVFMGVTFYWLATYSGPYRAVSEWQIGMWGSYYPALSLVALNLPVILVIQLVRKLLGMGPAPRTLGEMFPIGDDRVRVFVMPVGIFTLLVSIGAWFTWTGVPAGDLRPVAASDLLDGRVTDPVLYAELRGWPDERVVSIQEGSAAPLLYVPVHATATEGVVAAVIAVQENQFDLYVVAQSDDGEVLVRGLAERDDVPGDVRLYLEEQGVVFAARVWLIRPKVDPEQRKIVGYLAAGLGVVLAGVYYVLGRRSLA